MRPSTVSLSSSILPFSWSFDRLLSMTLSGTVQVSLVQVVKYYLIAPGGRHLSDPGTHGTCADNCYLFNVHFLLF